TSTPPCAAKTLRTTRLCSASAAAYPSAPSSCSNRVEPSTSVKSNVTVPAGSSRTIPSSRRSTLAPMSKIEPLAYEDKTVYSVGAFNRGVSQWLGRLPTVWVEGEVTELRRHERWASVFSTLKDPSDGSSIGVTMPRGKFDGLRLELADGERVDRKSVV